MELESYFNRLENYWNSIYGDGFSKLSYENYKQKLLDAVSEGDQSAVSFSDELSENHRLFYVAFKDDKLWKYDKTSMVLGGCGLLSSIYLYLKDGIDILDGNSGRCFRTKREFQSFHLSKDNVINWHLLNGKDYCDCYVGLICEIHNWIVPSGGDSRTRSGLNFKLKVVNMHDNEGIVVPFERAMDLDAYEKQSCVSVNIGTVRLYYTEDSSHSYLPYKCVLPMILEDNSNAVGDQMMIRHFEDGAFFLGHEGGTRNILTVNQADIHTGRRKTIDGVEKEVRYSFNPIQIRTSEESRFFLPENVGDQTVLYAVANAYDNRVFLIPKNAGDNLAIPNLVKIGRILVTKNKRESYDFFIQEEGRYVKCFYGCDCPMPLEEEAPIVVGNPRGILIKGLNAITNNGSKTTRMPSHSVDLSDYGNGDYSLDTFLRVRDAVGGINFEFSTENSLSDESVVGEYAGRDDWMVVNVASTKVVEGCVVSSEMLVGLTDGGNGLGIELEDFDGKNRLAEDLSRENKLVVLDAKIKNSDGTIESSPTRQVVEQEWLVYAEDGSSSSSESSSSSDGEDEEIETGNLSEFGIYYAPETGFLKISRYTAELLGGTDYFSCFFKIGNVLFEEDGLIKVLRRVSTDDIDCTSLKSKPFDVKTTGFGELKVTGGEILFVKREFEDDEEISVIANKRTVGDAVFHPTENGKIYLVETSDSGWQYEIQMVYDSADRPRYAVAELASFTVKEINGIDVVEKLDANPSVSDLLKNRLKFNEFDFSQNEVGERHLDFELDAAEEWRSFEPERLSMLHDKYRIHDGSFEKPFGGRFDFSGCEVEINGDGWLAFVPSCLSSHSSTKYNIDYRIAVCGMSEFSRPSSGSSSSDNSSSSSESSSAKEKLDKNIPTGCVMVANIVKDEISGMIDVTYTYESSQTANQMTPIVVGSGMVYVTPGVYSQNDVECPFEGQVLMANPDSEDFETFIFWNQFNRYGGFVVDSGKNPDNSLNLEQSFLVKFGKADFQYLDNGDEKTVVWVESITHTGNREGFKTSLFDSSDNKFKVYCQNKSQLSMTPGEVLFGKKAYKVEKMKPLSVDDDGIDSDVSEWHYYFNLMMGVDSAKKDYKFWLEASTGAIAVQTDETCQIPLAKAVVRRTPENESCTGRFEMVEVINTHDFTIDSGVLKLN